MTRMPTMKFRLWSGKEFLQNNVSVLKLIRSEYDDGGLTAEVPEPFVLLRATGVHDKHDREIYEGDLLYGEHIKMGADSKEQRWIVEVVFEEGAFCYGRSGDPLDARECAAYMEIVGNKYQNPDINYGQLD